MNTDLRRASGFTLIELLVTLALVGTLTMVSMPLFEVISVRHKESELREALRTIRSGLDAYKLATDSGFLAKSTGESGYPPSLDELTRVLTKAGSGGPMQSEGGQRLVILRRLPRDPFYPDPQVPAVQTWNVRSYASPADDPQPGDDVFDVSSKSNLTALDGSAYSSW